VVYGLLLRCHPTAAPHQEDAWLCFVEGRPVSEVTTRFLAWVCGKLEELDKRAGLRSTAVRSKGKEGGVRILPCPRPAKSPWLNPIEPRWVHAKRRVVEAERVCGDFGLLMKPSQNPDVPGFSGSTSSPRTREGSSESWDWFIYPVICLGQIRPYQHMYFRIP
jgi:hypothetical protein